jgi:hypothetical protein
MLNDKVEHFYFYKDPGNERSFTISIQAYYPSC